MKIAYITYYPARTVTYDGWSGTSFNIAQALQAQGLSLDYVHFAPGRRTPLDKIVHRLYHRPKKNSAVTYFQKPFIQRSARYVEKKIQAVDPDVIFIPGYLPSHLLASLLRVSQPIVIWSDATCYLLHKYLPAYRDLSTDALETWFSAEKRAYDRGRFLLFSTGWAAQSAIQDHYIDPAKVRVIPFGANLPSQQPPAEVHELIWSRTATSPCRLIFIGRNWFWKGGDIALAVVKRLNQLGLDTELTILGSTPPADEPSPDYVKVIGLVDKGTPDGLSLMNSLLGASHFLLHPTRVDSSPIVFCEANSYGVPCLARRTGGVPWVVKDGINGMTFADDGIVEALCDYIVELIKAPARYQELASASYREYQTSLNWEVAGIRVRALLDELV